MLIKDLIKELEKLNPNANIGTYNCKDGFADIDKVSTTYNLSYKYQYVIEPKEN